MLVCHCNRVSDREIRAHARQGGATVRSVCQASRAGTNCGGCMPLVKDLVRQATEGAASAPPEIAERTSMSGVCR